MIWSDEIWILDEKKYKNEFSVIEKVSWLKFSIRFI